MVGKKLVVKVVNARNLMPKDGQGSASAFVQVVFDGQRKTTRPIVKDLNPIWEETFEFPITDIADMANEVLEIDVFDNSRKPVGKKSKFLGRVSLNGSEFVEQGKETLNFYRLDKRGLFSLVRGELGLIIYYIDDSGVGGGGGGALNADRGALHAESSALKAERGVSHEERSAFNAPASTGQKRGISALSEANREHGGGAGQNGAQSVATPPTAPSAATKPSVQPLPPPPSAAPTSSGQPPTPPPSAQSNGQPPTRPAQSNGQPPTRPPPPAKFNGQPRTPPPPPPTAESTGKMPTSPSPAFKSSGQNLASPENFTPTGDLPVPSLPSLDSKSPDPPQSPPFPPLEMPPKPVELPLPTSETPPPALEVLPTSADPLLDVSEAPSKPAESPETVPISPAAPPPRPPEAPSPAEKPPNPQPNPEVYESLPEQEDLETMPLIARTGESQLNIESPNVEVMQPTEADYALKDTRPTLGGEKSSSFDLIEKMHYLFVRVVKARSLIAREVSVNPHPYTRVVLGNLHAKTQAIPNTLYPEWDQVFAFGNNINAGNLEVSLWDHNTAPLPDSFLGAVLFDLSEIPTRLPPDSPLAPQWYGLEQKHGEIGTVSGDIMLCVWIGTQADEAFSDAWQSDTGGYLVSTRSRIYLSPKLWYLRFNVIEAQDLQTPDGPHRLPEVSVKLQLGFQTTRTRVAKRRSVSPFWNEDLMLVASEPLEDSVVLTVEDHQGVDKHEIIGTAKIPLDKVEKRVDDRQVLSRWYNLQHGSDSTNTTSKFQGRVHLRVCLDGGYHVIDETTHLSSDMRPSAKQLWKPSIGVLELGILGAQSLLPMKNRDGRGTVDAYCVAKYGPKWVRTRTILDNLSPRWNEQYTWEVYDPCTVLTLCVFDNGELEDHQPQQQNNKHARIGKVRVRLSTLEADRVYTISYPLLVLQPGGLKKVGDIEIAVRFSCISLFNLIHTYTKPLLPRMHYLYPLSMQQQEVLRTTAMKMVALRLSRCEPSLRPEVVQYILDADSALWSMRRSKANWFRISHMMGGFYAILTWLKDIRQWRNPVTTLLVHVLFIILLCYPELILPTIFFYMFLIGLWQFRSRNRSPPHIDPRISQADVVDRDELDEEFDTLPTSKPPDIVKLRYERLRGIAGRIQMVLGDIATQGERLHGLLTWRDPRATSIFVIFCFFTAVCLYIAPFRLAAFLVGIHFLRHPKFQDPLPSTLVNFFQRLPAQSDRIL